MLELLHLRSTRAFPRDGTVSTLAVPTGFSLRTCTLFQFERATFIRP